MKTPNTYMLNEFASLVGKSANLCYRRLTEQPPRYRIRFARREGGRWVFDRQQVDAAIARNESLIVRIAEFVEVTDEAAIRLFVSK